MVLSSVSRTTSAVILAAGAIACSPPASDQPEAPRARAPRGAYAIGEPREPGAPRPHGSIAPDGAHLTYFGGRIVSNLQVVQVLYGQGSYLPEIESTAPPSMAAFYQGVLNSSYVDWLGEYDTAAQPPPSTNQVIGRGSFLSQVTIAPSAANDGVVVDDAQLQAELSAQIRDGRLPAPSHDAQGNNNTYYAVFFPHGKAIRLGGASSCEAFCAYHGTIADAGGSGEISYGVQPDFQSGSGCERRCGTAATPFGNATQIASHQLIATMTDPELGVTQGLGPPFGWFDPTFGEIGDICIDQNDQIVGADGIIYDVQTQFSNAANDCVVSAPPTSSLLIETPAEACRGGAGATTVTVLGGDGRFTGDVALSVTGVSPAPPPGGELTATFDPDPVPVPPGRAATAAMQIATTPATPPGTYTLAVQGASPSLTTTVSTTFVVRGEARTAPALVAPADGADGVPTAATFRWTSVDQATLYTLELFDGDGCAGPPIRAFDTTGTAFTLPPDKALDEFQRFSWQVTASNSCGRSPISACSRIRTASCNAPRDLVAGGGFEDGLSGWTVDQNVPPPLVSSDNPHTGRGAVQLGTVSGFLEPFGDAQISQIVTLPSGGISTLRFFEWPLSADFITFDQQYVRVTPLDPPGSTVELMRETRDDEIYVLREFDLSRFNGATVRLTFGVHEDGAGDITGMFIDDVSVTSQNCGAPDFVIRTTPPAPAVCAGASLPLGVAVESQNGVNFTSQVALAASHLPPGATASFAQNPIRPGESTILTLATARPTAGDHFAIEVSGVAVAPPPDGPRTVTTTVQIDANPPDAPELVSPRAGEVNVSRRPTLTWTAPFVPDSLASRAPRPGRALFPWELGANRPPGAAGLAAAPMAMVPSGAAPAPATIAPFAFGAASYRVQVARDAAFTSIVADAQVTETSFTLPVDLDIATPYFWRVSATNACGTGALSATGTFIVGACFEGWTQGPPIPLVDGPAQASVVASPSTRKIYVVGGGLGPNPDARIDQVWAFDPANGSWTRKADVPGPGVGASLGSAVELGGTIYVFGGLLGPPGVVRAHRALWRYDVAADRWSRGKDLPADDFSSAVAAIDGKIYLAYGSGLGTQTWRYDPVADTYTPRANGPLLPGTARVHAAVLGGEMHVFGGGFNGSSHVIYNAVTNTWRIGPAMPFTATDPAVGVIAGKALVVGGRPIAHTQIYDPVTNSWSQGPAVAGAATGLDNTAGAVLGPIFHVIGGFDGTNGVNRHAQLHACTTGALSSATILPFVVDGNGKKTGIGDERTALVIDNAVSTSALSVSCFLYGTSGDLLGADTIRVAANEVKTVTDVVRVLTHTTAVQNTVGSVALFGTDVFQGMASLVHNASSDSMIEDGQPITGTTSGYVSTAGTAGYLTQTVFANVSTGTSAVSLFAYPAAGGDTPVAGTLVFLPAHGQVSYPDVVKKLGLAASFTGQLTWTASQPIAVMARDLVKTKQSFSGAVPVHGAGDAASTVLVPYVEDTTAFATALEISNPGPTTANVTVHLIEAGDATGTTAGVERTRDLPVAVNAAAPIADIVRWVRRETTTTPSGKRGFLVVTTPQKVTAQARIVDRANRDPAILDSNVATANGFSPLLIRVEQTVFALPEAGADAAAPTTSQSRFALANPGASTAVVQLIAYNATGSQAATLTVTLAASGQFFTENLAAAMGLPPVFLGWVAVQSTSPVVIYNHRRTAGAGSTVPIHGL